MNGNETKSKSNSNSTAMRMENVKIYLINNRNKAHTGMKRTRSLNLRQ